MTFGHYEVTFHIVTSGQNVPLGWILRNFRLRMRTPNGNPKGSLPVAMLLVLQCVLVYYKKKKKRGKIRACAEHTSVTSLPVL